MGYYFQLLRWNKPSGRLILLIPAGWSLWLTPAAPPSLLVLGIIILGGLFVSGAGCIANDIWDRKFDKKVIRTKERPLANGKVSLKAALILLIVMLFFSLCIVLSIPQESRNLCLLLSSLSLPFILLYPSAKRWFQYPQLILSICWGFPVNKLKHAHSEAISKGWNVTDDASLFERLGLPVKIYDAGPSNIKVTTPFDLVIAESLLSTLKD